jgi:MipA family protein
MNRPLLSLVTLPNLESILSCAHGNFWYQSIFLGSPRYSSHRLSCRLDGHQLRPHRKCYRKRRKEKMLKALFIAFILFIFTPSFSFAQVTQSVTQGSRPLWEGGIALVSARVPAYPGADQYNLFTLPFPSFFYRGNYVRADEEGGMRGRFFKNKTFEINLSIGGSLPANSSKNEARQEMPDLKTLAELGPGLLATLWKYRGTSSFKLGLNIPLRTALALDFWEVKEKGLVFNPLLYFISENFVAHKVFTFTGLSSVIASQKFHRNFYQVDPAYVTATRPQYHAHSGYLSTTVSQGFSTQIYKNVMSFFGISYSHYKGSANFNSPLLRQSYNFNMALGIVWWFYESETKETAQKIKKQLVQNKLF